MEGVENKERWLNCVMLNGSSWRAEKDVPEGRGAELDVFIGNGAQTKRRSSWSRERVCEERLQNCLQRQIHTAQKKLKTESALRKGKDCGEERSCLGDTVGSKVEGVGRTGGNHTDLGEVAEVRMF